MSILDVDRHRDLPWVATEAFLKLIHIRVSIGKSNCHLAAEVVERKGVIPTRFPIQRYTLEVCD